MGMGLITLEGYEFDDDLNGWLKRVKRKVKKVKKKVKKTTKKVIKTPAIVKKAVVVARSSSAYKEVAKINKKIASSPVVRTAVVATATYYGGPVGAQAANMALDQLSGKKINFKQLASNGGLSVAVNAMATYNPEAAIIANEAFTTAKEAKDKYKIIKEQYDGIKSGKIAKELTGAQKQILIEKYAKQLSALNKIFDENIKEGTNAANRVEQSYKESVINQYSKSETDKQNLSIVYDKVNEISNVNYVTVQANTFKIKTEYVDTGIIS